MSKCLTCRKEDAVYTPWERFRRFFFHMFSEDIQDLGGEQFTKGFGRGYEAGFQHARDFVLKYQQLYDKLAGLSTPEVVPPTPGDDSSKPSDR